MELGFQFPNNSNSRRVILMRAVREIHAENIRPRLEEGADGSLVRCRWPQCRDNLSVSKSSHVIDLKSTS